MINQPTPPTQATAFWNTLWSIIASAIAAAIVAGGQYAFSHTFDPATIIIVALAAFGATMYQKFLSDPSEMAALIAYVQQLYAAHVALSQVVASLQQQQPIVIHNNMPAAPAPIVAPPEPVQPAFAPVANTWQTTTAPYPIGQQAFPVSEKRHYGDSQVMPATFPQPPRG